MTDSEAFAMRLRHLATAAGWTLLVAASFAWNGFDWRDWQHLVAPIPIGGAKMLNLAQGHFGIWLAGLFGIAWAGRLESRALRLRRAAEEDIRRLAYEDSLTGLHNRASLNNRLAQVLALAQREPMKVAAIFVDLDWFKRINDSLGHDVGDLVLKDAARRLQASVRKCDIVARLGGDEFVVVLAGLENETDATTVAGKMLEAFEPPFAAAGHHLRMTPSIGIALFPRDGETASALLKNADAAMYHAKEQGRAGFQFFREEMNALSQWRLAIEGELRETLAAGGLALHYQPKVCARDDRICGFEALLRWPHPLRGSVSPADFIPVAEQSGLIDAIGHWVLDEACRQLAAWERMGIADVRVAVNLSSRQLAAADLAERVRTALDAHGVAAAQLELEVTESAAMADPERAVERLRELRAIGVTLAIDDFGTGYSSLAYLKRLPVQTLKIDKSFVQDIGVDANDTAIVAATLALAKSLGLTTVAEGVETAEQRDFLYAHGCHALQGYLLGKPASAENWTSQLKQVCREQSCQNLEQIAELRPQAV